MRILMFILLSAISLSARPGELIYTPVNPNFGGSPLNGNHLLGNADAQNDFSDKRRSSSRNSSVATSDLDRFNDLLQRSVLSRVASAVTSNIVDSSGNLIPGQFETSDFTIDIIDLGSGRIEIVTVDKSTGESTSFTVTNDI